jgi:hypothetical protein
MVFAMTLLVPRCAEMPAVPAPVIACRHGAVHRGDRIVLLPD